MKTQKTEVLDAFLLQALKDNKNLSSTEIAKKIIPIIGKKYGKYPKVETLSRRLRDVRSNNLSVSSIRRSYPEGFDSKEAEKKTLIKYLAEKRTLTEICNKFDFSPKVAKERIEELEQKHFYNVVFDDHKFEISKTLPTAEKMVIDLKSMKLKELQFGAVGDTHLASKYERLDILNALYDIFQEEGITQVFHGGNLIDGYSRLNKNDVIRSTIEGQVDYAIEHYPQRRGITTFFIAGDDHEGWWTQREGINIGGYIANKAKEAGRSDLAYLGYLEKDIVFETSEGAAKCKVMHPGGGSAYALSYSPQKMIESFQGGEKPHILLLGHYHKAEYIYYRDVHCVQMGCTQDQTPFLRKQKIQVALGGWKVILNQSRDGSLHSITPTFFNFFNKKFYKEKNYYRY